MTATFILYDQDQQHLLPKDLSEWIEKDSLERFVSESIAYLDEQDRLEPLHTEETEKNRGWPEFHPVMLLKVLVFASAQGIRNSGKIEQFLERDVALRYLAANQQPDFGTISDFRKDHREDFRNRRRDFQGCLRMISSHSSPTVTTSPIRNYQFRGAIKI